VIEEVELGLEEGFTGLAIHYGTKGGGIRLFLNIDFLN
jgi:hypothetical protein